MSRRFSIASRRLWGAWRLFSRRWSIAMSRSLTRASTDAHWSSPRRGKACSDLRVQNTARAQWFKTSASRHTRPTRWYGTGYERWPVIVLKISWHHVKDNVTVGWAVFFKIKISKAHGVKYVIFDVESESGIYFGFNSILRRGIFIWFFSKIAILSKKIGTI